MSQVPAEVRLKRNGLDYTEGHLLPNTSVIRTLPDVDTHNISNPDLQSSGYVTIEALTGMLRLPC